MNTPVIDFLNSYNDAGWVRAHMPGHKGKGGASFPEAVFPFDITEISGADSLFEADGILLESEENASSLFHSGTTVYSAGGSTLSIQTMLSLACRPKSRVVAARNAHKAFLAACALWDLDPVWIYPKGSDGLISFSYTPAEVEKAIKSTDDPACVYITSPDYFGRTADIKGISQVCKKYGVPLLVDNAHGAHLAFLKESLHPMALGADICCDSAHKTLPVLTGGGYLHTKEKISHEKIKDIMSLYGSTSPSYLILASLDGCNKYLSENTSEIIKKAEAIEALKADLSDIYEVMETEPFHLTIKPNRCGLTGTALSEQLRLHGIECEYADGGHAVLLFSSFTSDGDLEKVRDVLKNRIRMPRIFIPEDKTEFPVSERIMSVREAAAAPFERISVGEAEGRICGWNGVPCPPGIPVVVSGEKLTAEAVNVLKKYGIFQVNVIQ